MMKPKSKPVEVKAGQSAEIPPPPPPVIAEKPGNRSWRRKKWARPNKPPRPRPLKASRRAGPRWRVRQTSQEELVAIQKSTVAKVEPKKELEKAVEQPPEMKETMKRIEELEKKAIVTVIEDIRKRPKALRPNFGKSSSDQLRGDREGPSHPVDQNRAKRARTQKRFWTDNESIGAKGGDSSDAYEKYFKVVD